MKKHIGELSHRRTAGHKRENQGVSRAGPDVGKDSGATLRCLTAMRRATLSPSLINGFEFKDEKAKEKAGVKESAIKVKNKDFVKGGPKMTFICDHVSSLYKDHPDKGQIIYLPEGIERFDDVKDYLVARGIPRP